MERSLDERWALRAPRLFRGAINLGLRLPLGSGLRRRAAIQIVRRGWAALSRGDDDVVLLFFDREIDFNIVGREIPLDIADHYRGHAGWLEFIAIWRGEWAGSQITHTPEALIDLGDRLVTRVTLTAQGARSGLDVAQTMGIVAWFANGAIVRQDNYWQWSECVEALGLDERSAVPL